MKDRFSGGTDSQVQDEKYQHMGFGLQCNFDRVYWHNRETLMRDGKKGHENNY